MTLTAEAVADREVPRTPRISPDGRWVVFVTAPVGRVGPHPVTALWLVPSDGSTPPRRLPCTGDQPRWAADSGSVFFLAGHEETSQLHRIGVDDSGPERLTKWPTGIDGFEPLPDGSGVVLIASEAGDRPDPRVRVVSAAGRPVWDTVARRARLWRLELPTGEVVPLGELGSRHVREVAVRQDGGALGVLTWSGADREPGSFEPGLHVVDLGTGATRDLDPPAFDATSPVWWLDGTDWRLAYLGVTPPGLIGGTAVLADGENLTAGLEICPLELAQADDGRPLVLFAEGLDTTIRPLDPAFPELARVRGHVGALNVRGDRVAVVVSTGTEPDDVHAGPATGPLTRLSETAPEFGDIRWGTQERLSYRASDGLELDGLLILPPGEHDGPLPLVTLIHGGPDDRYSDRLNLGWFPSGQWLATAGFAVFLPNPRGGWGHGHAFAVSVAGDVGGAEFTDVLSGIDLLVERGIADPARLGIGGWSHGGFFAAWAVTQTDRFAAALVGAGVTDWPLLAVTGELTRFDGALGGRENSPITHAARIRTPVLILHGEDDTNVPLSQAEVLHRALLDRPHEFVVYPREGHSIRGRDPQLDVLRRTRAWFSDLLA
ncbi:hypothetical protein GCM10027258_34380 [Amycolatopsis stemonae]